MPDRGRSIVFDNERKYDRTPLRPKVHATTQEPKLIEWMLRSAGLFVISMLDNFAAKELFILPLACKLLLLTDDDEDITSLQNIYIEWFSCE